MWLRALLALILTTSPALAHDGYRQWVNNAGKGCCNDHDCRPIDDASVRTNGKTTEVEIGKHWCEVRAEHYLATGNAPDWSTAHVCIQPALPHLNVFSPCARLLCFQPKPQF